MESDDNNITLEFASSTTLHGVHHLIKERSKLYKIIWWLFIVTSVSICTWQISIRVMDYLDYPISREIHESLRNEITFPAVTFCMGHRVKLKDISPNNYRYYKLILETWPIINRRHKTTEEEISALDSIKSGLEELFKNGFNFTHFILETGYLLNDDNLKICRFGIFTCKASDFEVSLSSYGTCYTYNGILIHDEALRQQRSGYENGLEIILDVKMDEYEELLPPPTGAFQIYIHPRYDYIQMLETGIIIGPGMTTYVGMTYTETKNLHKPYGPCDPFKNLKTFKYYTGPNCLIECKSVNILQNCKCSRTLFLTNLSDPKLKSLCGTHDIPFCFRKPIVRVFHENMLINCPCPIACEVESYDPRLSFLRNRFDDITEYYANKFNISSESFTRNFIVVNVYYETMVAYLIEETRASTLSSLISDIGGQLGLCLGMSMLTLLEVLEYFIRSLWLKIKRNKQVHADVMSDRAIVIQVSPVQENKNSISNGN